MKASHKISKAEKEIIPEQKTGAETGAFHELEASSIEEAKKIFERAKKRLRDINNWKQMAGAGAEFALTDKSGKKIFRKPQQGDLIKIDLPGPGTKAGDGYDWVEIEKFESKTEESADTEFFAFRTRPVQNPEMSNNDVAHFYTDTATSTFLIERKGRKLLVAEIGRNEVDNTKTSEMLDKLRNKMVATGAKMGVSSLQWKFLVKGILEDSEDEKKR